MEATRMDIDQRVACPCYEIYTRGVLHGQHRHVSWRILGRTYNANKSHSNDATILRNITSYNHLLHSIGPCVRPSVVIQLVPLPRSSKQNVQNRTIAGNQANKNVPFAAGARHRAARSYFARFYGYFGITWPWLAECLCGVVTAELLMQQLSLWAGERLKP